MTTSPLNLVLLIADAYRQDSLGVFNPDYRWSPNLSERLSTWYQYPLCFSSAPWTLPSCTTILSGIHASTHGRFFHDKNADHIPTIAHHLPDSYSKLGVVNNANLRPFSGLDRGFDHYQFTHSHDGPFTRAERFVHEQEDQQRPYFLFLHTNLPHDYAVPISRSYYEACFPDRQDWFSMSGRLINWNGVSPSRRSRVRSIYDACVSRMDQRLSTLIDTFDLSRTVVCFVADHGEGFDHQNGRLHHGGRLHDDLIRVPLAIHIPVAAPPGMHVALESAQQLAVGTSDIVPTLLEILGVPPPSSSIDGRSLLRLSEQGQKRVLPSEDRRYLYLANKHRFNVNAKGKNTTRYMRLQNLWLRATVMKHHRLNSCVEYPYKLIVTSFTPSNVLPTTLLARLVKRLSPPTSTMLRHRGSLVAMELFDLSADPQELHNLLLGRSIPEVGRFLARTMPSTLHDGVTIADQHVRMAELVQGSS